MSASARIIPVALLALAAGGVPAGNHDDHWSLTDGPEGPLLQQESATSVPDEYAVKQVRPRLQFRCDYDGVTVRIDWQRFISSFNTEVGFSPDGADATWLKWGVDRSNRVTRSPTVADTEKLLALLDGAESLSVEVSPYSEGPVTVSFDVSTFAVALDALRSACD